MTEMGEFTDIPYVAIDPGEEEAFMVRSRCPECGAMVRETGLHRRSEAVLA